MKHCWLHLRPHANTGSSRVTTGGHIYTLCARCGREYLWRCPEGCHHDVKA